MTRASDIPAQAHAAAFVSKDGALTVEKSGGIYDSVKFSKIIPLVQKLFNEVSGKPDDVSHLCLDYGSNALMAAQKDEALVLSVFPSMPSENQQTAFLMHAEKTFADLAD